MFNQLLNKFNKSALAHKLLNPIRDFTFQKKDYQYFGDPYNTTYLNEHAVEVPIFLAEIEKYADQDILEIGNVLAHYHAINHVVVDKYEVTPGVINEDIVNFKSKRKFKLIISISTLEHVGWDETPRSKTKILDAMKQVKSLLAPGGIAMISLPLGYNTYLDKFLKTDKLNFDEEYYLKRVSAFNSWKEVGKNVLKEKPKYNEPFQNANVIVIGKYRN